MERGMFTYSNGEPGLNTGARLSNAAHLSDRMYRTIINKLSEALHRRDFDVNIFARNMMANGNAMLRDRMMQLAIAFIDAGAELHDQCMIEDGTQQAKRLQETVDLYQMPRG
jgi:cell division ATPase FtsA